MTIHSETYQAVFDAMPDAFHIARVIGEAVCEAMPEADRIVDAIRSLPLWSSLPPGSHLVVGSNGRQGDEAVALRSRPGYDDDIIEVITEQGYIWQLDDGCRLRIGP